jgi:signal transduction histidine kinase
MPASIAGTGEGRLIPAGEVVGVRVGRYWGVSASEAHALRLPAWLRHLPAAVVDAAITLAVAAATAVSAMLPASRHWWVPLAAVLASAPLLWRRRAPVTTLMVVGAATSALALIKQLPPMPYGVLVGTYTVASLSPPLLRLVAMVTEAVCVPITLVVPHAEAVAYGYVGMAFVTAYALGADARARRARIAALEEERAAVAERERTRIARDMHDIVTHAVGLMVVQAEAGPLVVRTAPDQAVAAFEAIAGTGREAIVQLRRIVGALRSGDGGAELAPQPGLDAVPELVERARRAGLDTTLSVDGTARPVPADVDIAAYRIVQESLTNTIRHAGARAFAVRLTWADGTLVVAVRDDGRGAARPVAGHGMIGMRERVAACGGTLWTGAAPAGSGPGSPGFLVSATLPIA